LSYLRSRVNELLLAKEGPELCREDVRRREATGALHSLCSAAGKAVGAVAGLSQQALRCISPRNVTVAAGMVTGAVSGVCLGIGQLASLVKHSAAFGRKQNQGWHRRLACERAAPKEHTGETPVPPWKGRTFASREENNR
jgi:hypothetical protein